MTLNEASVKEPTYTANIELAKFATHVWSMESNRTWESASYVFLPLHETFKAEIKLPIWRLIEERRV